MTDAPTLGELQLECWQIADDNGFHDDPRSNAAVLALVHSEVSEALEADREGDTAGYAVELADIVIRVLDHAEEVGVDLEAEVLTKMEANRDRAYKHGKEY